MARARWIKPEFFTDAKVCAVSDRAALVFAAIWVEADDGGVAPGDARDLFGRRFIKRAAHGWTTDAVGDALRELEDAGLLRRFTHRGEAFVLVPEFAAKQGITPKKWRHLGAAHDEVTNAVRPTSNGGSPTTNAVREALPPKPLAGARARLPSAAAVVPKTDSAQRAWDEVCDGTPEAYHEALIGILRASRDPDAVACAIRALGPGGVHARYSWEVVGRAAFELAAAGGEFTPRRLDVFARHVVQDEQAPVPGVSEAEQMRAAARRLGGAA